MIDQRHIIPAHVDISINGNGRWAQAHGLLRAEDYQAGVQMIRTLTPV